MHTPKRSSIRRGSAVALALVAVASLLSACEPAPPPTPRPGDGVDLGLVTNGIPAVMGAGRANNYAVRVANFGTATATNAVFWILAPLSFSIDGAIDGVECDQGGNNGQNLSFLGCTIGDIAPGQTVTVDLEAWLGDWSTPRDVTYGINSDGEEAIPDTHPNSVKIPTTSNRPAFSAPTVAITAPESGAPLTANDTIAYAGTASDEIDGDLSDAIVWSYVPAGDPNATATALDPGANGSFGPVSEGIYVLIASVTHSSGATAQATTVLQVGPSDADGHELGFILDYMTHDAPADKGGYQASNVWVRNWGTSNAVNTKLVVTWPTSFQMWVYQYDTTTPCPTVVDTTTGMSTATCPFGSLRPMQGQTAELLAHGTLGAPPTTVELTTVADGAEPNPDPHPNTTTWTFTPRYYTPPTLAITTPGAAASVSSAAPVPYGATAATSDHTDLSDKVEWSYTDADDPEAEPIPLPTGASGTFGPLDVGRYKLTASVDDGTDQVTTRTRTFTVHAPVVSNTTGLAVLMPNAPTTVPAGVTTTFPLTLHNFGTTTATGLRLSIGSSAAMHAKLARSWRAGGTETEKYEVGLAPGASVTYLVQVTPDADTTSATLTGLVRSFDGTQLDSVSVPVTVTDADPSAPTLTITAPQANNTDFATTADLAVAYSAAATDPADGDLSDEIAWTLTPLDDPLEPVTTLGTGAAGSLDPMTPGIYLLRATVTDSAGTTATSSVVVTVLPAGMSCSTVVTFLWPSGLYLPQYMSVDAARSYDSCGRPMQFYWDAVYTAVSEQDRLDFNATMNNAAQDVVGGNFTLQQPDEWIINLVVCTPALGSIAAQCALPVSRDYASADVVWNG